MLWWVLLVVVSGIAFLLGKLHDELKPIDPHRYRKVDDPHRHRQSIDITVKTEQTELSVPEKDAWEDWDADLYGPGQRLRQLGGLQLHINFTDREGKKTRRDITTQRYSYNPETKAGVLYGYCHMRNGNRPFALNRITKAVDLETGEIIPDLGAYLDAEFEQTALYQVEQFLVQHDAGAFVLFSLAKADGAMRAKERAVLLQWAQAQGLQGPEALSELEAQFKSWYMTKSAFWDAVKSVKKIERTDQYMQGLWRAATELVLTDKKLHEQETQFLRYAAEKWGIPASEVPKLLTATQSP